MTSASTAKRPLGMTTSWSHVLRETGLILLVAAIIPVSDILVILAAKGSAKSAFCITA